MTTTVMVGEKPKVASKLAQALGDYSIETNRGVKNYILRKGNDTIIIAPAVGHLFNLNDTSDSWDYPVFDVEWAPTFETSDSADYMKKYYNNLRDQLEKADEFINACDYDLEGCLHKDEQIVIKKDGEIRVSKVGKLVDTLLAENKSYFEGEFEFTEPNIEIVGMDDWSIDFQKVEKVMRRPSDKTYFKITAADGREIKVSGNHPLLIATENGLETKNAGEITKEDFILASKNMVSKEDKKELDLIDELDEIHIHGFKEDISIESAKLSEYTDKTPQQCSKYIDNDQLPKEIFLALEDHLNVKREKLTISAYRGKTKLPAKLHLDERLGKIVGLYLAEGFRDSQGFVGLNFRPEEHELVEEVESFLQTISSGEERQEKIIKETYEDSERHEVQIKSLIFRKLIEKLGLGVDSGTKKMPSWILSSHKEFKKGVISGYWNGNGSIFIDNNNNRAIASTKSESRDLLNELFYILQTLQINPSFQERKHSDKQMESLTLGRNKDVKILSSLVKDKSEFTGILRPNSSRTSCQTLNSLPTCLAQRQNSLKKESRNLEPHKKVPNSHVSEWEESMRGYSKGDVTFLQVTQIEEIRTESEYFYDFQTESRNFQHGNGIISHNSVIGSNVIKHLTGASNDRIKRMKFSTLTAGDLQEAYEDLEEFDEGMTEAGLTRHVLDFYYGINVSRALMKAVRANNRYKTLSTGRVQGPALAMLAEKEREIMAFDPDPYWEIFLKNSEFDAKLEEDGEDRLWKEEKAEEIFSIVKDKKKTEVVDVSTRNYKHNVPTPFNLTDLQSEASSQFRINPKQTQAIAQTLYENGLISYPRTESQKLPAKIGHKNILKKLKNQENYENLAEKVLSKKDISPKQGKKKDDAHPAIYPTGEPPGGLSKKERNVYDLIVKRFFAVFGKAAKRQSVTMTLNVEGYEFKAKSKITKERNWFNLYDPYVRVEGGRAP